MNQLMLKLIGHDRMDKIFEATKNKDPLTIARYASDVFNIKTQIKGDISSPKGPTIFLCTHHSGGKDFLAVYPKLKKHIENIKIIVNKKLLVHKPLAENSIGVNPISSNLSNEDAKKEMKNHLLSGGHLLLFPAGKVGIKKNNKIEDMPWRIGSANLIKNYAQYVVPIYVDSDNGSFFYRIRKYFPKLSLFFIFIFMNHRGKKPIPVTFGKEIETAPLKNLNDIELMTFLRNKTYQLGENHERN